MGKYLQMFWHFGLWFLMQSNVYFAARYNCILNYLSIPVIVLGGVANVINLRIFHCDLAYIWCIFTIPRIFRHVCNCKEIIQWKLDEIVKTVNYFSNFVVPNRTFRVFFHFSSRYLYCTKSCCCCLCGDRSLSILIKWRIGWHFTPRFMDRNTLPLAQSSQKERFYSLGIRQIRPTRKI